MANNGKLDPILWANEKRKLSQLIPWPRNPRQIEGEAVERLQGSLQDFGQVEPVAIGPGNELYNGHQRLKSWASKYGDIEIDVRVSSRALTEKEREKLTVYLHRGTMGGWNFDELANTFEFSDLVEWGFDEDELLGFAYDNPKLKETDEDTRQREMFHVLISVPVDLAIDVRDIVEQLEALDGCEVVYGAN